jgi:hypothetical protein
MAHKTKIQSVTRLSDYDDEYVYDIGVKGGEPFFTANNLLVHNSAYFSAWPILKDDIESGKIPWTADIAIAFYDAIGTEVNDTFAGYMARAHNCPATFGKIIAAKREVVASTGLFIIKKRYGLMVIDDTGVRKDTGGKPGKMKAMGLDLKRSDTPAFMQEYLKELLTMALTDATEDEIVDSILAFRIKFKNMKPWEKGTPKRVNNLTKLTKIWNKTHKCRVGHALAAINYNAMLTANNDRHSMPIVDGMKTIVCQLKSNPLGMKRIGIPVDEKHIPPWFQALPFDEDAMEESIITKKVQNLFGVLPWDLTRADHKTTFNDLFTFT